MKKIFVVIAISVMILTGCNNKMDKYEEIEYNDFFNKIDNKDDFILFIGSATCQHCTDYKKTVNKIIKDYQVMIYYIDINKFSEEELSKFKTIINFSGTPTTVFIKDGKEISDDKGNVTQYRVNGNLAYSKVVDKIKKAEFIKE